MKNKSIFVTGGAGYVGSVLVPKLLAVGHRVTVLDLMIYGEDTLEDHPNLTKHKGDIRNIDLLKKIIPGHDSVIHLACISNDPSFELNPALGKSINLDAFSPLVEISKDAFVKRFIYASSSSVYGIKEEKDVHEEMTLEPLTDYSKFKAECETILSSFHDDDFITVTLRPATVCGVSPRQRLDVAVNMLTLQALERGEITVFGGDQTRPNIHVKDLIRIYLHFLCSKCDPGIYNAGFENLSIREIAERVHEAVPCKITTTPSNDPRSYRLCSDKLLSTGFVPKHSVAEAMVDLQKAYANGDVRDTPECHNVKWMMQLDKKEREGLESSI